MPGKLLRKMMTKMKKERMKNKLIEMKFFFLFFKGK